MKEKLGALLVLILTLFSNSINAQNLYSNGDFESYSSCPMGMGQAYLVDGLTPCTVTPDYFNGGCGFLPSSPAADGSTYCSMNAEATIPSGSGFIKFFGGLFDATRYQYESFIIDLNASTIVGQDYEVSFELFSVDRQYSPCLAPGAESCLDFAVLFFNSSTPVNCPTETLFPISSPPHPAPHASMPCNLFIDGSWNNYTLNYTADGVYDRMLVYFYPNANTALGSCAGSWPTPMSKIFMDDLCVKAVGTTCTSCSKSVNAGTDQSICSGDNLNLIGTANSDVINVLWTTSGDGVFSNSTNLITNYTPGTNDLLNGSFTLTLSSNDSDPLCPDASSTIEVIINEAGDPTITEVASVCSTNGTLVLEAAQSGGTWSGTGIINASTGIFSPELAGAGNWTITYSLGGGCPTSDETLIEVVQGYTIDPLNDLFICEGETVDLSVVSTGGAILQWSTFGDGEFSSLTGSTTNYTPGLVDINVGEITISVQTDEPLAPCVQITESLDIIVMQSEELTIFPVGPLCTNDDLIHLALSSVVPGFWSGVGITDPNEGVFSPIIAGEGEWVVAFQPEGDCLNATETIISVVGPKNTEFEYEEYIYCVPADNPEPILLGEAGGVFDISPNGTINPINGQITLNETNPGIYSISYSLFDACNSSTTVIIEVCNSFNVKIPNVFTPNNDGVNENYELQLNGVNKIQGIILNRWGTSITEFDIEPNGISNLPIWDGKLKNGQEASSGVYFYKIEVYDLIGNQYLYEGFFEVLR